MEQYQQAGGLSGGDAEADAHTTVLTLTAMLSQSWAGMAVSWVACTCPFLLARSQKVVEANTLSISRVHSSLRFPSSLRSPSCHRSWLVSIRWGASEDSSDVFSEPAALPCASSLPVCFHLQMVRWWMSEMRRCSCEKTGTGSDLERPSLPPLCLTA